MALAVGLFIVSAAAFLSVQFHLVSRIRKLAGGAKSIVERKSFTERVRANGTDELEHLRVGPLTKAEHTTHAYLSWRGFAESRRLIVGLRHLTFACVRRNRPTGRLFPSAAPVVS